MFKRIKFHLLISVILLFLAVLSEAQNSPAENFLLSAQGHYGFIIAQHDDMKSLVSGHIYGGELNYIFRTDGCKPWQQIHKYPEIGVCALHLYLGNPQQLGTLEAIYPYTNIRLNKLNKKVNLNLRLGLGLAYITKPFDRITNHQDIAIGSHVNGFVNLRFNTNVKLTEGLRLDAGVGLTHASNGAIKTPNLGLNMATVNVGIGYAFGNKNCVYRKDTIPPIEKGWVPSIIVVAGIKQLETPDGPEYRAYGLQANIYHTINYKNKIGGGVEIAYNNATKAVWAKDSVYTNKISDILQGGVKISYSFTMHRLSLPIDFGVYLYKKQDYNGIFFHRIGLRYMVSKHIIANITLLTHFAKADYFEWGVGYQF